MEELIKKAGILIEALPFIQKFAGKTVVVKPDLSTRRWS